MFTKPRVIIFGTGWGFNNYMLYYADEYDIFGITDWGYNNHAKEIRGFPVLNPTG